MARPWAFARTMAVALLSAVAIVLPALVLTVIDAHVAVAQDDGCSRRGSRAAMTWNNPRRPTRRRRLTIQPTTESVPAPAAELPGAGSTIHSGFCTASFFSVCRLRWWPCS